MDEKSSEIKEKIVQRVIEEEMKQSYLDYSMSVIVGRALPDVRDGLKPVHRRVLYAMYDMGMFHNKPYKKCARIVGETLGKYHPHGDIAVYDALVRMAQDFSLRYPLIKGQGNFGCFTGDTKVKLTDGRDISFKELIKEHKQGKKNYTYTVNSEGLIEIAEIKNPRLTKKKEKIMKVVLDNGKEIRCTLDHRFMLRNGSYLEAQKLKAGDSLMPIHLRFSVEKALQYFNDFSGMVEQAKTYNHKIVRTEFIKERKDVYDLTIGGTHNFALASGVFVHNSIDGDAPAAQRYTEARLNKLAEEMLKDIEKETVKFVPNFDESLKEPSVLPSKLPNLLINGSSGIAVGMATNIPPHNISEVADGIIKLIDNPDAAVEDLMHSVKGPDFPTGALICGKYGIESSYKNGRGRLIVRAKTAVEEFKQRKRIIITEIPYMVNKSQLLEEVAYLVRDKKVTGIADLRDESDREGMRIVIELRQGSNPEITLNQLYKHSRLQTTFGVIMLALVDNQPKVLNLKELIQHYISHRKDIITKRTSFDLNKAEKRKHILDGLLIALKNIDDVIKLIKGSKNIETAKSGLIDNFKLSREQALAILDMKLQKLTSLEQERIKKEYDSLLKLIEELKSILASEQKVLDIIKKEITELKQEYSDKRRTQIVELEKELEVEDLIEEEQMVVTITHTGYIKRLSPDTYKRQRRGGKGVIATTTKEQDFVEDLFIANTHDYILFFTNKGKVYWLKVYQIPEASRQATGKAIINLLSLAKDENVTAFIPVKDFNPALYLFMATRKGTVKRIPLNLFSNPRRTGIIALTLEQNDELISVQLTDGTKNLIIATKNGMAVKFSEDDVRPSGRTAIGVRGIRLKDKEDEVIGMVVAEDNKTLLTVTENGYGKRTLISEYNLIHRGGSGVINIQCSERNGKAVAVKSVNDMDELMFMSKHGIAIRTLAKDISIIGRNTQGVRLMNLEQGDKVVSAAKIIKEEDNEKV